MTLDWAVLVGVWVLTFGMLLLFIPKSKIRLAVLAYLFKQLLTWFFGLAVVEMRLIEYPIRLFAEENRSSFTFEYLAYPAICAVFNVHYPSGRPLGFRLLYYAAFVSCMTFVEAMIEWKLDLIEYIHWSWQWTWITLFVTLYFSHRFCVWFYRPEAHRLPASS